MPHSTSLDPAARQAAAQFQDDLWWQRILLAASAALAIIPATRRPLAAAIDSLRTPSALCRRWIAAIIFIFSGPLLYVLAIIRGRILLPYWHDENMYRLQTTFLAHGKLWMPALPLPDFFDVPYVFTRPVYAPVYFPGTALLHVPAAWLHLPYCVTPLLIAAVILTLLYLIISNLIDGLAGLLAVLMMLSLVIFRWISLRRCPMPPARCGDCC